MAYQDLSPTPLGYIHAKTVRFYHVSLSSYASGVGTLLSERLPHDGALLPHSCSLVTFPSKKIFAGERYHHLCQAGEHVPT